MTALHTCIGPARFGIIPRTSIATYRQRPKVKGEGTHPEHEKKSGHMINANIRFFSFDFLHFFAIEYSLYII